MSEIKRTATANKLFNRILECENDLKQLYYSGFKLIHLTTNTTATITTNYNNLDDFFRIRTKLRCTYERLIIEESEFFLINDLDKQLWEECYLKPIDWIETFLSSTNKRNSFNSIHLRSLRNLLINLLDEGSTFFQLLLRKTKDCFKYKFLIYSAILLRRRENLTTLTPDIPINSYSSRAFNLLQDAITIEPFNGFGYLVMAKWTIKDSDPILSIYWALTALIVKEPFTKESIEFLKDEAKKLTISPSFKKSSFDYDNCEDSLNFQLLQMASHSILSIYSGNSHLKHLDQLSHSQINFNNCDLKILKYSCLNLWLIIDLSRRRSKNNSVSPLQSCLLAKLFQIHCEFLLDVEMRKILLFFSKKLFKLFSGENYEILNNLNNFTYQSLNNLLSKMIKIDKELLSIHAETFLDFIIMDEEDDNSEMPMNLIDLFLRVELVSSSPSSGELILKSNLDKIQKTEKSIKLLTHQFLSTQLKSLQSSQEPFHLPWTIPNYPCLVGQFGRIKKLITSRQCKLLVTLPILKELDLDKNKRIECREIIRFLNNLVETSDPCIKVLEDNPDENNQQMDKNKYDNSPNEDDDIIFPSNTLRSYRNKLNREHVKIVKYFYEKVSKDLIVLVGNDGNVNEYNFIPKTNLLKEL